MPINAQIPLGVQPAQFQLPDPNQGMNALARALQIKGSMQEGDLNALKMQEAQRGIERRNRLDSLLAQEYATPDAREGALLKGGFAEEAMKLGKDRRENVKSDAEIAKTQLETGLKRAEHAASLFTLAKDPQSYQVVRALMKQQLGQDLPEQFDPNFVQGQIAMGQTITQKLAAEHQRLTLAETQRHNTTTEGLTARGQNITLRGQNMVDARARESNQQGKTQIVETPQGFVIVDKNTGQSRPAVGADGQPLKGKANDRVMTDAQAKANLFGTRMKESDAILSSLEGQYSPAAVNAKVGAEKLPVVGGVAGYVGNKMLSDQGQQAEQAQRDFINAVLRRESGAVISEPEFENAKKQYFPQPGDSAVLLAQKKRNRQLAISGMEAEVPGGFRVGPSLNSPAPQAGGASGGWSIQKVN